MNTAEKAMVHLSILSNFIAAETHLIDCIILMRRYPNSVNVLKLIMEMDKEWHYFEFAKDLKECFKIASIMVADTTSHADSARDGVYEFARDNCLYNAHVCTDLLCRAKALLNKRKSLEHISFV